jgi:hypothetical protein
MGGSWEVEIRDDDESSDPNDDRNERAKFSRTGVAQIHSRKPCRRERNGNYQAAGCTSWA